MENNRKHERIKKDLKSEVHTNDSMTYSTTRDISHGGIYISTPEPIEAGSIIDLSLYIQGEEPINIKGVVRWARDSEDNEKRSGMGIEFIDASKDQIDLIKKNID